MRYLFAAAAALACCGTAFADAPVTISADHLQRANAMAQPYRQCLADRFGDRYLNLGNDPMKVIGEVEAGCQTQLDTAHRFLSSLGYSADLIDRALIDIKARADGAAVAFVHRMPNYRLPNYHF
ncbi:hypothetical protein [Solimonas marina]|uniref:DUF3718 domain-containing protein n=1 Tax=Solimonas marina TaxID=2714601 RepID=A0A970B8U4_9GAMM|nr:hypothetical protein [Solimonas marina]NKF21741.1 hypothetical protein [Solimonas marina]